MLVWMIVRAISAGGSEKVESVVSASERSRQSCQPHDNVPGGSQQTDMVLPKPKVNVPPGQPTYLVDDVNKMRNLHALFQAVVLNGSSL